MERFQTVNGGKGTTAMHPTGTVDLRPPDFEGPETAAGGSVRVQALAGGAYGACLFLGDRGERCMRKALASGFCARHGGGGKLAPGRPSRVADGEQEPELEDRRKKALKLVASLLGLAFLLGPVIADAIRALLAMMQDH